MNGPASQPEPDLPAAGSSFYLGMRILPKAQREAMYAVYGFCRAVDDVADSGGARAGRRAALEEWREDVDALFAGDVRQNLAALGPVVRDYALPRQSLHDVIDGMEMDVDSDIQAPDWAVLDLYCDRVASAVGRLSTRIFGLPDDVGDELSHHLGRALQLTNILRDIDEDAAIGRLYLPREALMRAGIHDVNPSAVAADPRLSVACGEVVERARSHYAEADRIMDGQPRALVRAPRIMSAAYRPVLDRMVARGFAPPRTRVSKSKIKILAALLRYGWA